MLKWSARTWVLNGFAISICSVVLNTMVLSGINSRLAKVSAEQSSVKDSLSRMATEMQRAENKYELVRVFHWVAMQLPEKQQTEARKEVAYQLVNYFTRTYAATHDVPPVEVIRTEMVELEDDYKVIRQLADLSKAYGEAKDDKERSRIEAEIDKVDADSIEIPKTELGKHFHELEKIAYSEANCDDEAQLLLAIAPTLQELREAFITLHETKSKRLAELDAEKSKLQQEQSMCTYFAVALQLFGLLFIMSRDVVKDINETRKKAAEAKKTDPSK